MEAGEQSEQSRGSLTTFLLVLAGVGVVAWQMIAPYLLALLSGGVMAMFAYPLCRRLRRHGPGPRLAAALVTLGIIVLVVLPFIMFGTLAVRQAITVGGWATSQSQGFSVLGFFDWLAGRFPFIGDYAKPQELESDAVTLLQELGRYATTLVVQLAKNLPETILHLFLGCVACFFLLADGPRFVAWIAGKVPMDPEVSRKLLATFKDTAIGVVWASMAAAAVQAAAVFLVFISLGVPAASLAMVATFIFAWIPLIGSVPVWLIGMIYLGFAGATTKLIIMVVLAALAGLADHLIRPLVLHGRSAMHPLVGLVAIFGGIHSFGLTGVLFGPILAAVVITLLQVWPDIGRRNGLRFLE